MQQTWEFESHAEWLAFCDVINDKVDERSLYLEPMGCHINADETVTVPIEFDREDAGDYYETIRTAYPIWAASRAFHKS